MGEKKNLFFTSLFEQGTPHFYFAQGSVNYIVGPDPRPFYPAINNLSVTLDICSKLKPLLVDSPLIYWALCLPACRFLLPALPPFSQRPPALCCSLTGYRITVNCCCPCEICNGCEKKRHQFMSRKLRKRG